MENDRSLFEIETLQDWRIEAGANQQEEPVGGGASNSNSCCNNSADQP